MQGERYPTDETDSIEKIGGQPQVSSKEKPVQVQGIEDSSSRKNSIRDGGGEGESKPAENTSAEGQNENLETNNSSSGVLTNDPRQDLTNKVYKDIDTTIESIRNEWNRTFIVLLGQYVEELIIIIGRKESFNILIANLISDKVDELLNQIIRTKNELTVIINNADRDLYEWTLGELMAIKGCLTDRQALVEQLASFSAELITKLECTPCADINTFKPFKPISVNSTQLSPVRSQ